MDDHSDRDEAMRRTLFPHLSIEEFRRLLRKHRRAFEALPTEEQQRIHAKAQAALDSKQVLDAWAKSVDVIRKASRRDP